MAISLATNRLPSSLLVHVATPVSYEEEGSTWIEGEPGPQGGGEPVYGKPFPCVLFMPGPGGAQNSDYRSRRVREPQILYNPLRADGTTVEIGAEDELDVTAADLAPWTGGVTVRWLASGDPQPFGPPGSVYGLLAILTRVED